MNKTTLVLQVGIITYVINCFSNTYYLLAKHLAFFSYSTEEIGLLVSAFYAATILSRPIAGILVERFGVKKAIIAGCAICATGGFSLLAGGSSFWMVLPIRIVTGFANSLSIVALTAYQTIAIPENARGRVFALVSVGSIATLCTVVPLSDWLFSSGWRTAALAIPPISSCLSIFLALSLQPVTVQHKTVQGRFRDVLARPSYPLLLGSAFLLAAADSTTLYVSNLAETRGVMPSLFLTVAGLSAIGARTLGRELLAHAPRNRVAAPSYALMGLALLGGSFAGSNVTMALCGAFFGVGIGYGFPAHIALIADLLPPFLRARGSALVLLAIDANWMLLPLVMGFASPLIGLPMAFRILALLVLLGAVGMHLAWRHIPLASDNAKNSSHAALHLDTVPEKE